MKFTYRTLLPLWLLSIVFQAYPSTGSTPKAESLLQSRRALFTENKGQVSDQNGKPRTDVKYLYGAPGLRLALKANGFSYEVIRTERFAKAKSERENQLQFKFPEPDSVVEHIHRVDITFVGANANPTILAEEAARDYKNYYLTHTPEEGVTGVRSFARLTYKNLYPNIDVVFYAKEEGKLKYDFILHPGARLSDIKMQYTGQQGMTAAGTALKVFTSSGEVQETIPESYYEGGAPVEVGYKLVANTVGFAAQGVEKVGRRMVLDPNLVWGTYYGDKYAEIGYDVAPDDSGNVYFTGKAISSSAIATSGAYKTSKTAKEDAFLSKFTSSGTRLWGTYYGGSNEDMSYGAALDDSNRIYITGETWSTTGIATSGIHQTSFGGGNGDGFLAKFTSSGSLVWGTYYGGSHIDFAQAAAIDDSGNVIVAGRSYSTSAIATNGAHQTSNGGSGKDDAFLAKFTSSGARIWGTYYGGSDYDYGWDVALDDSGNAYMTGYTISDSGIATSGAHQTSFGGGSRDAFLAKFTSSGRLSWGTYFGGSSFEYGRGLALDDSNNIYFIGYTGSTSGIATSGTHQTTLGPNTNGFGDAFLAKFTSSGKQSWGTYYGGSDIDDGWDVALDKLGSIYITGRTYSKSQIATSGAHKTSILPNNYDAFVANFYSSGKRLWATYYGGNRDDLGIAIALDKWENVYVTGETYYSSSGGIATSGAHQTSAGGGAPWVTNPDAFFAQFSFGCSAIRARANDTAICAGTTSLKASSAIRYRWYGQAQGGTTLDTNAAYTLSLTKSDTFYVAGYDGTCESKRDTVIVTVNPLPTTNAGKDTSICAGNAVTLGATSVSGQTYSWTSKPLGFASTSSSPTVTPSTTTTYHVKETITATGCSNTDSVKITANPLPKATTGLSDTLCADESTKVGTAAVSGHTYAWTSVPSGFASSAANPQVTPTATTWYYLKETISGTGCSKTDSIIIIVNPKPKPSISNSTGICTGLSASHQTTKNTGSSYAWTVYGGTISSGSGTDSISVSWGSAGSGTLTVIETNAQGCSDTAAMAVTIHPNPTATWTNSHLGGRSYGFVAADTTKASYAWQFGNGSSDTGYRATYTYGNDSTYTVSLNVTSAAGCQGIASDTVVVLLTTLLEEAPSVLQLSVQPNPFTSQIIYSYSLPRDAFVKVQLYNTQGLLLVQSIYGKQTAGLYSHVIDAEKLKLLPGTYFLKFWMNEAMKTNQLIYVK